MIGTIVATDEDTGDSASVAIVGGASYAGVVQFVVGGTGVTGDLKVATGASLNFELKGTYTLAVVVTDTAAPTPHTVSGSVTVNVVDVNEPPTVTAGLAFSISEHNTAQADCTMLTYCKPGTLTPLYSYIIPLATPFIHLYCLFTPMYTLYTRVPCIYNHMYT